MKVLYNLISIVFSGNLLKMCYLYRRFDLIHEHVDLYISQPKMEFNHTPYIVQSGYSGLE